MASEAVVSYVLLEWVGWWTVASYNGECPGLFESPMAAWNWVQNYYWDYTTESYESFAREVLPRFQVIEFATPPVPCGW